MCLISNLCIVFPNPNIIVISNIRSLFETHECQALIIYFVFLASIFIYLGKHNFSEKTVLFIINSFIKNLSAWQSYITNENVRKIPYSSNKIHITIIQVN